MLKRRLALLFGSFSWNQPPWLWELVRRIRARRVLSGATIVLLLLILNGSLRAWHWYERRPKPLRVGLHAEAIPVTRLEKELRPFPLTVVFDESVAKLEEIGRTISAGVRIDPPVEGQWKWASDRQLSFCPKRDWPAKQKYHLAFARTLFPSHIRLERYALDVETALFAASITAQEFYQDPTDPALKQIVMTIEFTHRVERAELERRIDLSVVGGSKIFKDADVAHPFSVTYGSHDRVAYVRSAPLQLPPREDFVKLVLREGIATAQGGARTTGAAETKVRVPDLYSFFKIEDSLGQIVRNADRQPEQVLIITTTAAARSEEIQKALHLYSLPKKEEEELKDEEEEEESPNDWSSPSEVDEEVLKQAKAIPLVLIPSEHEQSQTHSFKFNVEDEGQLFVRIDKGVQAVGGFPLGETYENLIAVPPLPREIEIQGRGGILALNGERKLSIKSRGVGVIQYDIARIATAQINHLVTQNEGRFENPVFNGNFDEENIARIAVERQPIALENKFKANYSAFDFSNRLRAPADGSSERGLFLLSAREWDSVKQKASRTVADRRFVLVTDIGLLAKKSAEGASDVFLISIKSGEPLAGVAVEVLAKNGEALAHGLSEKDGHVAFPSLGKLERERTPVAFVARLGDDVAFIPFADGGRALDFSRFDTEGVENLSREQLDAFVFTERGVYRPGDEVHIGAIVKQRDWRGQLEGLPIEAEVIDARGTKAQVGKIALPALGFAELKFSTNYESPTGQYQIHLYLVREGKRGALLGQARFYVKEFLPDRMKIETQFSKPVAAGWIEPKDVQAFVTLRNLYGTPASARRIASRMQLEPRAFRFAEFKDYSFHDPLRDARQDPEPQEIELGEKTTDADGKTTVDLDLERFVDATYQLTLATEGFEAEGGRSVAAYQTVLVSALPHVIGYKADGPLDYLPKDSRHTIEFIAVDSALKKIAVEKLRFNLLEQTYVSILAKKENGSYAFESVRKERLVRADAFNLGPEGFVYQIDTGTPGNFVLEVRDETDRRVSRVSFAVVGRGNVSRALDRNAELALKLDRAQYNAGDEIELSIVAPFTGAGLITIESDRVHAHQWFKSSTTSSVQRIRVPEGFDGNGYVNVSFVRALDSKEIFMSPLSYAVVPLTVNKEKRRLRVELRAAKNAKPGEPLKINYRTDRPSKIVVFAVEKGILQVTDFTAPDPLGFFFRKTALGVETSQIVDLIIPEFSILRNTAAFGGDADKRLNPFKRVTEKPVVFWSGMIDAGTTERELVYDLPDYFDGTLTLMAVSIANDAVGSAEMDSIIRGSFVITPAVPTVAAPGDRFEVGVTIANNTTGSGENAEVSLTVEPSSHLEIIQAPPQPLRIAEGRERTVTCTVRVKDELGSATLTLRARAQGEETVRRATLSVRPAVPFMTEVRSGNFAKGRAELPITRAMYPQFRELEATISATPLGLAQGLDFYLKTFPHGCTEQICSAAFARLILADEVDFGLKRGEVEAQLEKAFATLRRRQNDKGAFGYWTAGGADGNDFVSVYATHLLSEAKAAGFAPPPDLLKKALQTLQSLAASEPRNLADARTIAYAIFVLTREGFITTNYILNLSDTLEKQFDKKWSKDLTSVYLAGAWSILKKEDTARKLVAGYRMGEHDREARSDFYQPLAADAQYLALVARHFPDLLKRITKEDFAPLVRPIGQGEFNTLSAAYAIWALKSYSRQLAQQPPELQISEIASDKQERLLKAAGQLVRRTTFAPDAVGLRFATNSNAALGSFYQVVEAGYDRALPTKTIANGLEISRELPDRVRLGEPTRVTIRLRALSQAVSNVAIIDLLPGGFEIVNGSLGQDEVDHIDVREDRALIYGDVGTAARTFSYQIKATNRGEFIVPPPYAESMYERGLQARGLAGRITVVE